MLHRRSTAWLAFFLMLLMVLAAVLWGACKGWASERAQVEAAQGSLTEMLSARREVITNILTVAGRHLPAEDEQLAGLRADRDLLVSGADLARRAAAHERLTRAAGELMARLAALPSVQADARDSMYVRSMLPQALEQSQSLVQEAAYNQRASDFNQRLGASFSGRLASLLGVRPAQQFTASEDAP